MLPGRAPELDREAVYQLDALVEHLEESGFEPVVDATEPTVDLGPCLHAGDRPVLCRVHLGLMQGVFAEAGGPLTAVVVDGAVPSGCTVQLTRRAPRQHRGQRVGVVRGMA